jgi:hypothetical protein
MFLSTEQTRAVMHGIGSDTVEWQEFVRPVGPQPIPDWCKGVHVNWLEGYGNSPSVTLKVRGCVRDWPDQRFRKEGSYYRAYHPDGRMEQYAHDGKLDWAKVQMFQSADGTLRQERRWGTEWGDQEGLGFIYPNGQRSGPEPGEWVEVDRMATTQQEGFGGRHYHLKMEDGSDVVLRGPWMVGAPEGYDEACYIDVARNDVPPFYSKLPWHQRTATAGLYVTDDLFVRIMSRFAPHLPLAKVTYSGATTLEPMKPEWDAPKTIMGFQRRQAALAARQ